ncbi:MULTISPECIES: hypothetical protein [Bifidobacterium]|nr:MULTISPECIES: hypothetical protein [Bifidobacterium]
MDTGTGGGAWSRHPGSDAACWRTDAPAMPDRCKGSLMYLVLESFAYD